MKIVITSEHRKELDGINPKDNIIFFTNKGRSPIEYFLNLKEFVRKNEIGAIINFGIAGSLDKNLPIGKLVQIRKVFYLDPHSLKFMGPTMDLGYLSDDHENLITLTDTYEELPEYLSYSGKILDQEGYFVTLIGKDLKIPVFIFKSISDYNKINKINLSHISSSVKKLEKKYLPIIEEITRNAYKTEFFLQYKYYNHKIYKKIEAETSSHKTFTERQNLYKDILLSGNKSKDLKNLRIGNIYIEKEYLNSKIANNFIRNFPEAKIIKIDNYLKLFANPGRDYYKSKEVMNLFLAKKRGKILKKTPEHYGLPGTIGYALSNMYNCIYDCSYCYLAGYFKSGDMVIFINYEDMKKEILRLGKRNDNLIIYAGDFSDSLLFDNLTRFTDNFYEFLSNNPNVSMEIRTKRGNIDGLLKKKPIENLIIAVTISPDEIIKRHEGRTMSLVERIELLKNASHHGYKIGIRMDPIIGYGDSDLYKKALFDVLKSVKRENVHSIGVGTLRITKGLYKTIIKREIDNQILKGLKWDSGMYRYNRDDRNKYYEELKNVTIDFDLKDKFYITME